MSFETDQALITVAQADTYATPPAALEQSVNSDVPTPGANVSALEGASILVNAPLTAFPGVLRSISAPLANAEAGRTIEFYILQPNGAGGYTVIFASGAIAAPTAETITYTPPNEQSIRIPAGCVIGAATNATSQANSIVAANLSGLAGILWGPGETALVLGTTYTAGVGDLQALANWNPAIGAVIAHEATMVPTRWGGAPGGFLQLDTDALALVENMPAPLGGQDFLSAANGDVLTAELDLDLLAEKNSLAAPTAPVVYVSASLTNPNFNDSTFAGQVVIATNAGGSGQFLGIQEDGVLTRVVVPPAGGSTAGAVLQAWVVRPETPIVFNVAATISFSLVAAIGEISTIPGTNYSEFANLAITVKKGDLIALRTVNGPLLFVQGDISTTGMVGLFTLTDLTMGAVTDATLTNVAMSSQDRIFPVTAYVYPGSFVIPNSTRDASGNLPRNTFRSVDQPWAGKKLIALGTSITADNPAGGGTAGTIIGATGYVAQAFQALYANGVNNGVGSSGIIWNGTSNLSLSATTAELMAAFGGSYEPVSYQTLMMGLGADLVFFDHGYNDRNGTIGTMFQEDGFTPSMDRSTFYGAYNYLIAQLMADRPNCRFVASTPISAFNPSADAGVQPPEGFANTLAIRTAILAIATYYQYPVLDWTYLMGLNLAGVQPDANPAEGPAPNFRGAFDPTVTYALNDQVVFTTLATGGSFVAGGDGRKYISLQNANTGNLPTGFPAASAWWIPSGYTLDGVHPDQQIHNIAARVLYRFLLSI